MPLPLPSAASVPSLTPLPYFTSPDTCNWIPREVVNPHGIHLHLVQQHTDAANTAISATRAPPRLPYYRKRSPRRSPHRRRHIWIIIFAISEWSAPEQTRTTIYIAPGTCTIMTSDDWAVGRFGRDFPGGGRVLQDGDCDERSCGVGVGCSVQRVKRVGRVG